MDRLNLRGLGVALVTPFKKDKSVDYNALERVASHVVENGADYLVVLGTTGESATLTSQERVDIRRFIASHIGTPYHTPLIAGFGGNNTSQLIHNLKVADLSGYDAILSVTPFYNKPSQEGLYQHFAAIASASPLPIILYNVPGRTGVNISSATTLRLAHDFNNIIGIKEASGNFKQIEEIINGKPLEFQVISGDDGLTYPLISLGAEGVISVVGNAFPREFGDMVKLCLEGNFKSALPIHYSFQRLYDTLFVDGNPAGIKCLLQEMGLIENELRLPLVPTRIETSEKMQQVLIQLQETHKANAI